MATINRVEKTDYEALRINYTSRDYTAILDDLINSIPGITEKWNTTDQNDPGMVLVKLIAMLGDMLNFEQDMQTLEIYPSTVTQRKNAASIYKLIGYKMKWYRSATCIANVVNTYTNAAYLPRFCTFTTENNDIVYSTFNYYDLPSNSANNGNEVTVELVQGIPVTPVRNSGDPYPSDTLPWHYVYDYNYTIDDMTSQNRIYLPDTNIDQDHIIVVDDKGNEWILQDNIYLTSDTGRFFEFDIDVNDRPYLEFIDYWKNYNVTKFKIFYLKSLGQDGQVYTGTLKRITGNVWTRLRTGSSNSTYNVSSYINFIHHDSTLGYNPETPDEARKESTKYLNTLDTLITLADFERATLRLPGVANVRATDLTNDPGIRTPFYIGDVDKDGEITGDVLVDDPTADTDLQKVINYVRNKTEYPLGDAWVLADLNRDGEVNLEDIYLFKNYLTGDTEHAGMCGKQTIDFIETLKNFVVKLYILRYPEYEDMDPEFEQDYVDGIIGALEQYKILPLNIEVDLHSIRKCYWSITGKFVTTEPLSLDELQSIIVRINSQLKFQYSVDKVNFNTAINYKDIIETILQVDNRILMVDLDPITYNDDEGNDVTRDELIGRYTQKVEKLNSEIPAQNLDYLFYLENVSILPGSVMIRINGGEYIFRDNNNGEIINSDGVLQHNGTIDYYTGKVTISFVNPLQDDIYVDYVKNEVNVPVYKNLSTQTFYFDSSSLKQDNNVY